MTYTSPKEAAYAIRDALQTGQMTYSEAIAQLEAIWPAMDATAKEIAKRHGVKHRPLNIRSFLR